MHEAAARAVKFDEVARQATAPADRILDARIAGRPILPEQIGPLTRAASLLQDHGLPWPPLVEQVLHEFAAGLEVARPVHAGAELPGDGEVGIAGLSRFLGAIRRERGLAPDA